MCYGPIVKGEHHAYMHGRYDGEWQDDRFHGKGACMCPDACCRACNCSRVAITTLPLPQSAPAARLTLAFAGIFMHINGDVYTGEFVCSDMEGQGVYRSADGTELSGASVK